MGIKAIIFDFGGTLAKGSIDREEYNKDVSGLLKYLGHDIAPQEVRNSVSNAMELLEEIRRENIELTFHEIYSKVLSDLKIHSDKVTLEALSSLYHKRFQVRLYPCVEDVLKELSTKYKLAIISNTISDVPRVFLTSLGLNKYFEMIVCSSDLGIRKPDPRIFQYVMSRLDVKPSETFHVGDGLKTDVEGAARAGIRAVWIRGLSESRQHEPSLRSVCDLPLLVKKIELEDK